MILVFDLSNVGIAHVPFNHGYLQVLRHAFPGEPIRFFGEPSHCSLLAGMEPPDSPVRFETGPFLGRLGAARFRPWEALPKTWKVVRAARAIADADRPRFVAFLSGVTSFTTLAVRRLWTDRAAPPLDLVLHSDIAEMARWRSRNPLHRLFDWHTQMRRPMGGLVRFVVLEHGIRDNLLAACPIRAADTVLLDHPVPEGELCDSRPVPADPLDIGFLGDNTGSKGFGTFLALARAVPGPRYHALGRLIDPLPDDAARTLATPPGDRLPRAVFLDQLRALDLVVLPLTRPAYDWTASGTLIDCVTNLVPVVTTRTRVTEAVFADHGPIGVMVERPEQIADTIRSIDAGWLLARREELTRNLRAARTARLPATLAHAYPGHPGTGRQPGGG